MDIYETPLRKNLRNESLIHSLGLNPDLYVEQRAAYLPRAVSTVPSDMKDFLEKQYSALIDIVSSVNIEPLLPFELKPGINPNEINPENNSRLLKAKLIIPLTYAVSDGRGWEMGFSYALGKTLIPLVLKDEKYENADPRKKVNVPTIRLPFQIPIAFNDLTSQEDSNKLSEFLKEIITYDSTRGYCDKHGPSLIGIKQSQSICLKDLAERYFEVISFNM